MNPPDPYKARERERLLLQYDAALSGDADKHAAQIADLDALLVRMLAPRVLASHRTDNALLLLERRFEEQVAELETHCHVTGAAALSVFQFLSRCDYFVAMVEARKQPGA